MHRQPSPRARCWAALLVAAALLLVAVGAAAPPPLADTRCSTFSAWAVNVTSLPLHPRNGTANWTQPGAWSTTDCSPAWGMTVARGNPSTGLTTVASSLPVANVKAWITNNGAANYGLLLKSATSSSIALHMSQFATAARRPVLEITSRHVPGQHGLAPGRVGLAAAQQLRGAGRSSQGAGRSSQRSAAPPRACTPTSAATT